MREDLLKGLNKEQIEKLKACKSTEEILELAKSEGIELTDEQLECITGGGCNNPTKTVCPFCQSTNVKVLNNQNKQGLTDYYCKDCHGVWSGM